MSTSDSKETARRIAKLREKFVKIYGHHPEGIWRAPGRVNLIGEHTDYNLGYVLPFAIDKNALVAVRRKSQLEPEANVLDFASTFGQGETPAVTSVKLDELAPGSVPGWAAYPAAVLWVLNQLEGLELSGLELLVDSDVPVGSGLSSSHALEVGTIVALNDLYKLGLAETEMARLTQRAENEFVGAPTGIMDQSASLMSHAGHALFLDCRSMESEAVPLPLLEQDAVVLVIDTKVEHSHVDGGYAARRDSCEQAAAGLGVASLREVSSVAELEALEDPLVRRRAKHIVTENQRVLDTVRVLREGNLKAVGKLLYQSHESMRDDYEISSVELDVAVEAAMAAGAIGARMTGGGFGGSAIALISVQQIAPVSQAVETAYERAGYARPAIFTVIADEGAGKA
ncbi:galactokinase [Arthrobacter sp. MYb211]|uniref:galactokinase n=1 Tax=unclassified Arthrobacter TaxID=235627 RepID=UPI000CFDCB63|nr:MULTISPECIES: galactokinase [unclassified Arthrobacter]PRA11594.1 galactokinase [Arthrobacter sp. MYb221]PRC07903.1 galactokinase [Arthrobacter sp. MYb211]